MNRIAALFALALFSFVAPARAGGDDRFWNIGPMVHYEFGGKASGFTFGVETSYWWESPDNLPYGVDAGVEFAPSGIRLYSEAQVGPLIGASVGPYVEFPYASMRDADGTKPRPRLGIQGSAWLWYLAAVDLRFRWDGEHAAIAPGAFAKYFQCSDGTCGEGVGI
jgi:hypothetical protein